MNFEYKDDTVFFNGTEIDFFGALSETCINSAREYAEPGYATEKPLLLFGNWNEGNSGKELLEKIGLSLDLEPEFLKFLDREFELEWEDEWAICSECGLSVRTIGDSYSWRPAYALVYGCEIHCLKCLEYDAIIADYVDNPNKAWTFDPAYLTVQGYEKLFEDWHGGIREFSVDPRKVYAQIKKENPDKKIVFCIDDVEQFGVNFSAYVKGVDND